MTSTPNNVWKAMGKFDQGSSGLRSKHCTNALQKLLMPLKVLWAFSSVTSFFESMTHSLVNQEAFALFQNELWKDQGEAYSGRESIDWGIGDYWRLEWTM